MTKQSSHPRRRRPNNLWIAMLATLAFTGAGQALAPAPAAALHIDACAQPDSGLCDAAGEGPTSGDSSSGDNKGGGGSAGRPTAPPPPSTAPWDQRGSSSVPTRTTATAPANAARAARYRRLCRVISDRFVVVQEQTERDWDWSKKHLQSTGLDRWRGKRDLDSSSDENEDENNRALQHAYLENQWERFNCEELGFSDLGL